MPDNKRDLSEDLFEAISTITNKYLEGLHYDKTILCTITDASKAKDGEYMVSDGNADFTAYSDNIKYKEKNSVYVTIPQGDFDNKRIIIGKYQKEDAGKPYNYIAPMDNFVNITENIFIPEENIEAGLLANGEEKKILIGTINTNLSYAGYNKLGIKADFKALLNSFNVETGNYGLLLEVFDSNSTETTGSYLMQLDCAEMFGNVYNFPGFTSQEKVFNISNSLPIEKIKVYLYQKNNFYDINGEKVPIQIKDKFNNLFNVNKNIFVDNININFGYDLSSFDNNSILLYTLNGKTYSSLEDLKQVKMRWIREIDGQLTILNDNDDLYKIKDTNFKIHWYRWKLEQNINDELAGLFWEEMEDNGSYFLKEITPNTMAQQERIKIGIEFLPFDNNDDENVAIEYIESEVLEFNNENQAPSAATLDLIKSLTLRTSDEYNGIYAIYGQNNSLMNEHEAKVKRYLIASYESIITGNSGLDNIEGIEWKVPAINTMIQVKDSDEQKWTLSDDKKYYISTNQYEVPLAEAGEEVLRELQMLYTIAPVYSQLDTNNTIICTVFKNGLSYISEFEMSFAISGTNGTDYTLIIEIENPQNKNAIALSGNNDTLQIKVGVQDYSHQLVKNVWYNPSFLMNTMETNFSINQLLDKDGFARFEIKRNGNIVEPEPLILLIKASIPTESKSIVLEGYLPIPQVSNDNLIKYSLEGPTKIIYSEAGQNPVYTKKPYSLFNEDGISQDITCEILEDDGGWPTLAGNTLIPALIYCIKKNNFPYVKIKIDDNNYWIQPLLIIINRFGSSMFNKWDGSLQIDEEGNKILSSVMAAGKKEDDNSFSGLLMGEVGKANGSNNNNIGLMGYQKGVRTFFLDSKTGNAILGSSGGGQITLSGESGTITSGNYKSNESGMQIDLTKGKIDAFNFKLTSKNIILDSSDENNNLFLLKNDDNKELIKISSRNFFLQSANFNNENSGFKLDLEEGIITGFNSKLKFTNNYTPQNLIKIPFIKGTNNYLIYKDIWKGRYWWASNYYKILNKENQDWIYSNFSTKDQENVAMKKDDYKEEQSYGNSNIIIKECEVYLPNGKQAISIKEKTYEDDEKYKLWVFTEQYPEISKQNETWAYLEDCIVKQKTETQGTLIIDSSDSQTPFKINSGDKPAGFSIGWDGIAKMNAGFIGGWQVDGNKLISNAGTVGIAKWSGNDKPVFWSGARAYEDNSWQKNVGFGVTGDGKLIANSGTIGGWRITQTALENSQGGNILTLSPTQGILFGTYQDIGSINNDGTVNINQNGAQYTATIKNGIIKAQYFDGYLNGTAYNATRLNSLTADAFALASHTHSVTINITLVSDNGYIQSINGRTSGSFSLTGTASSSGGSSSGRPVIVKPGAGGATPSKV